LGFALRWWGKAGSGGVEPSTARSKNPRYVPIPWPELPEQAFINFSFHLRVFRLIRLRKQAIPEQAMWQPKTL
jgi:hypothetical protein